MDPPWTGLDQLMSDNSGCLVSAVRYQLTPLLISKPMIQHNAQTNPKMNRTLLLGLELATSVNEWNTKVTHLNEETLLIVAERCV